MSADVSTATRLPATFTKQPAHGIPTLRAYACAPRNIMLQVRGRYAPKGSGGGGVAHRADVQLSPEEARALIRALEECLRDVAPPAPAHTALNRTFVR